MAWYFAAGMLCYLMMTADQWGGPHWLVGLGQGLCTMAIPIAIIGVIVSVCYQARTTPIHGEPSHDGDRRKNR